MKLLGAIAFLVAASTNVQADRTESDRRAQVAVATAGLAQLDPVSADTAAKLLGTKVTSTASPTPHRRDATLAPGALWSTITASTGGPDDSWRIVVLEPAVELGIEHVVGGLLDLPHEVWPVVGHPGNPHHGSTDYRFAGKSGELIIRADTKGKLTRILLTTERKVSPKSPTWRATPGRPRPKT